MKEQMIEMIQDKIKELRNEGLKEDSISIQCLKELIVNISKL